jgi:hypothetical protein
MMHLWPSDFIWKGSHDDQSFSDLKLLFVCGKHLPVIILSNLVCYVECKLWQWLLAKQRMCIKLCLELGSLCRETEFYPLKIFTKFSAFILVKYHFSSRSCVLAYFISLKQVKHFVSICKVASLLKFLRKSYFFKLFTYLSLSVLADLPSEHWSGFRGWATSASE